jgi:hypothetical protein
MTSQPLSHTDTAEHTGAAVPWSARQVLTARLRTYSHCRSSRRRWGPRPACYAAGLGRCQSAVASTVSVMAISTPTGRAIKALPPITR